MGTWKHRLTEIDEAKATALCAECGPTFIRLVSRGAGKSKTWRCGTGIQKRRIIANERKRRPWIFHKKDTCENPDCTATIEHSCQLDVDHIDGDNSNNDPSNFMTLCANCHRLKTYRNKDWQK